MLPEGRAVVTSSGDGASGYELALHLNRGALDPETRRSIRLAPPLAGRAALERIDREAVLALADPDDRDGDGISGRAAHGRRRTGMLGRYGWKAANAILERAGRRRLRARPRPVQRRRVRCRMATARR